MRSTFYATTGNMRPVLTSGRPLAPMASESQSFPSFLCSSHRFTPCPSVIRIASVHRLLFIPHKVLMFSSCYYFPVCLAVSIPHSPSPFFLFPLTHLFQLLPLLSSSDEHISAFTSLFLNLLLLPSPPPLLPHTPGATRISYFQSQIAVTGMPNRTRDTCRSTLAGCHLTSNEKRRNKRHRLRRR